MGIPGGTASACQPVKALLKKRACAPGNQAGRPKFAGCRDRGDVRFYGRAGAFRWSLTSIPPQPMAQTRAARGAREAALSQLLNPDFSPRALLGRCAPGSVLSARPAPALLFPFKLEKYLKFH